MPKCNTPECRTILCGPKSHPSGYCRACRGKRPQVFGQPSRKPKVNVADFTTTEEIDAEVKRLTELRATTLSRIARLEERKTQLPVPVDPATLRALNSAWSQFHQLADVLRSMHGASFQSTIAPGPEDMVRRLTMFLASHPNLLRGLRL